jgi:glycine amidinotransferase
MQSDFPKNGFPVGTYGPLPKEMEVKENGELDNFAGILDKRGIRLSRPTPLDIGSWHLRTGK